LPPAFYPEGEVLRRMGTDFWERIIEVRDVVSKELERLRASGDIGSPLDAEVDLYAADEARALLSAIDDELRFVLITSYARVHPLDECPDDAVEGEVQELRFRVRVTPSAHAKCIRCWHHRADVGANAVHPELCGRCVENVAGAGEQRRFA
jgi:isoleucyl-tRNA synthetase